MDLKPSIARRRPAWLLLAAMASGCGSEVSVGGAGGAAGTSSAGGAASTSTSTTTSTSTSTSSTTSTTSTNDTAPPTPACAALGGHCVPGKWAQCEPGFEPAPDVHAGCKPPEASRGYFCCVPAPPSPCSASGEMVDCFPSADCHPCWSPATDLACEPGRTCCAYTCLD